MNKYTEQDFQNQLKPYSKNGFVAFFQKIWRGWLSTWYGFSDKHPGLANLIYMVFFFIVFSQGVTIWQYIVMTFLPYAFQSLWTQPFVWPALALPWKDGAGNTLFYAIFNEPVKFLNAEGTVLLANTAQQVTEFMADASNKLQVAGLGNFIAFEIAVFTAQCINFPLQRNITYRSHGNPWYQAMWYFIGWVLVSIFTNAVWGIINPLLMTWNWWEWVIGLVKTFITGGVSMVIFFFIFMVIFPDNNKAAAKAKAKYERLLAANAPEKKLAKAEKAYKFAQDRADRSNAEKDYTQASTQTNGKVLKYFASVKKLPQVESATQNAKAALDAAMASGMGTSGIAKKVHAYAMAQKEEELLKAHIAENYDAVCEAIALKEEKTAVYHSVMDRLGLQVK